MKNIGLHDKIIGAKLRLEWGETKPESTCWFMYVGMVYIRLMGMWKFNLVNMNFIPITSVPFIFYKENMDNEILLQCTLVSAQWLSD